MEEKERYVYEEQENGYYFIYDNYEKRYLNVVTNCKILNQQNKELSKLRASYQQVKEENHQLKQQLAESEKNFIIANNLRKNSDEVLLNYKTEKYGLDKTIQELRKIKLSFPEKEWYYKGFENCERQMSSHIADLTLQVKELKQQLVEKDAERELDNSFWKQECDSLQKTLVEKDKEIENLTEELDDKNFCKDFVDLYTENRLKTQLLNENWKDKISFCIEQLEKVLVLIHNAVNIDSPEYDLVGLYDAVSDQIKQLKGVE